MSLNFQKKKAKATEKVMLTLRKRLLLKIQVMTYQDILSSVYSFVTSAGGTELLSRNDIVNFMNMAIGNLVAISDWSFLKDEKTITSSVPSTTFTLPCELYNEYTVYGIKDGAETLLSPSGGVPETREYDVSNLVFTTYEEYDSVRIHGNWGWLLLRILMNLLYKNTTPEYSPWCSLQLHNRLCAPSVYRYWSHDRSVSLRPCQHIG